VARAAVQAAAPRRKTSKMLKAPAQDTMERQDNQQALPKEPTRRQSARAFGGGSIWDARAWPPKPPPLASLRLAAAG